MKRLFALVFLVLFAETLAYGQDGVIIGPGVKVKTPDGTINRKAGTIVFPDSTVTFSGNVATLDLSSLGGGDMSTTTWTSGGFLAKAKGGIGADVSAYTGLMKWSSGTPSAAALLDADVDASAAIAWTKISKTGAVPGDVGIVDAAPTTKGIASFAANDFDVSSGAVSLDYTNGQAASGSVKGYLTAADWTTFNGKAASDHNHTGTYDPAGTAAGLISDTAYGSGWDTDITHAASKNAVYDKINALTGADISIHTTTEESTIASDDEILIYDASAGANRRMTRGNFIYGLGAGGGVILDLADNGANESSAIAEIAVTGDTNSIFTEPLADKLLIAVGNKWPAANAADSLAANGTNCSSGQAPLGVDAAGAVEGCWTPYADPLTTRGDLLVRGASSTGRLAIGTAGKLLASDGTDAGWSAFTVAAPGEVGAVLYSDGTNWTRSTAPTISAANMTSFPTFNQNTTGTAANLSGTPTLPNGTLATTQAAGDNSTKLSTTAYANALVSDTAYSESSWNAVTAIAPSKNAVRDQLELLAPKASPTFTGTVIMPTGLTGVLRADSGVVSTDTEVTDIVSAGSTSAAGKLQLATTAEAVTGTDSAKAVTAAGLTSRLAAPGAIGGTTPAAVTATTISAGAGGMTVDADGDLTAKSFTSEGASGTPGYEHILEDPAYSGSNYRGFGMLASTDYAESIEYKFPSGNNSANAFFLLGAPAASVSSMTYGSFGAEFDLATTPNTVALAANGITPAKLYASSGVAGASTVYYGDGHWGAITASSSGSDGYVQISSSGSLGSDSGLQYAAASSYGVLTLGKSSFTGSLKLVAETGATDYSHSLRPSTSMSGDIITTLPAAALVAGDTLIATANNQLGVVTAAALGAVYTSQGTSTAPVWSSAPQITSINLGHASDTTITRVSAGLIAVEGVTLATRGANTFTGLQTLNANILVGNGATGAGALGLAEDSDNGTDYSSITGGADAGSYPSFTFGGSQGGETFAITATNNLWTFSSATDATFAFTPAVRFTALVTASAGITIADSQVITFDESADDPNDADIRLSATDGVFKIAAANGANNEDLTVDVDATANEALVSSSTGVTQLRLAQGIMLGGNLNLVTKTAGATLTVAEMNGLVFMTATGTIVLPEIVASSPSSSQVTPGVMVCVAERDDNEQVIIDPNAADSITLDGTKDTAGDSIQNTVSADTGGGDYMCLVAVEADNWLQMGKSGTWTAN